METSENKPVSLQRERMEAKEFINFRELARKKHVPFNCEHKGNGNYLVECEQWFLSLIGY